MHRITRSAAFLPLALASPFATTSSAQAVARQAPRQVEEARVIRVPGKAAIARVWTETDEQGATRDLYQLSKDGVRFAPPKEARYDLHLRFERFDPSERQAGVPVALEAQAESRLWVVQYWTQGIEAYRQVVRERGGEIHRFLPFQSNLVEMDAETVAEMRALPFVRSVTRFHPAFKLEEELLDAIENHAVGDVTVNLLTMRRGEHAPVAEWVRANGGLIEHVSEPTYLMTATLRYEQLADLAALDTVQWIDRWHAPENDMDIARRFHGANKARDDLGVTGSGVNVEVMDSGTATNHPDMQNFTIHNTNTVGSHGTATAGIVVGSGANNALATGAMPDAHLVIADYQHPYAGGSRYAHTGQLVNPAGVYRCVLQTNSWGSGVTTSYNSTSQDMDLILFDHPRISILQSQSNQASTLSRPQAWAKNIIAVGGIDHNDSLTANDDAYTSASTGPAEDGRIKPDVASFYDSIRCCDEVGAAGYSNDNYTAGFGGTSGATPIVAGHLGLIYQMWHLGTFGNPNPGATVFDNRPQNTTAKALLINTNKQWVFSGAGHNLRRVRQGWGHPWLHYAVDHADDFVIIDETDVLEELESTTYSVEVLTADEEFRATLVYRDPEGTTSASIHRINDLDLTVVSPSLVTYHGNEGLLANNYSTSGGSANTLDTVENVLIEAPEVGTWEVTVTASEVNQDSHVETGATDVDYALVISSVDLVPTAPPADPSDLTARAVANKAQLRFKDNSSDESGFEVERSTDGVSFSLLTTLPANTEKYFDDTVSPNMRYHWRVRAINSFAPSGYTNVAAANTIKAAQSDAP